MYAFDLDISNLQDGSLEKTLAAKCQQRRVLGDVKRDHNRSKKPELIIIEDDSDVEELSEYMGAEYGDSLRPFYSKQDATYLMRIIVILSKCRKTVNVEETLGFNSTKATMHLEERDYDFKCSYFLNEYFVAWGLGSTRDKAKASACEKAFSKLKKFNICVEHMKNIPAEELKVQKPTNVPVDHRTASVRQETNLSVRSSSIDRHILQKEPPPFTPIVNNNVDKPSKKDALTSSNVGHRLLSRMGWVEGKGLGKECQGIREPIIPAQLAARKGLGYKPKDSAPPKKILQVSKRVPVVNTKTNLKVPVPVQRNSRNSLVSPFTAAIEALRGFVGAGSVSLEPLILQETFTEDQRKQLFQTFKRMPTPIKLAVAVGESHLIICKKVNKDEFFTKAQFAGQTLGEFKIRSMGVFGVKN